MRDGLTYGQYLQTDEWRRRRAIALRAAGVRCEVCGRSGTTHKNRDDQWNRQVYGSNGLHVHHVNYKRLGEEEPEDLIVLCSDVLHFLDHVRLPPDERLRRPFPNRVGCHERAHDDKTFARRVAQIAARRAF